MTGVKSCWVYESNNPEYCRGSESRGRDSSCPPRIVEAEALSTADGMLISELTVINMFVANESAIL